MSESNETERWFSYRLRALLVAAVVAVLAWGATRIQDDGGAADLMPGSPHVWLWISLALGAAMLLPSLVPKLRHLSPLPRADATTWQGALRWVWLVVAVATVAALAGPASMPAGSPVDRPDRAGGARARGRVLRPAARVDPRRLVVHPGVRVAARDPRRLERDRLSPGVPPPPGQARRLRGGGRRGARLRGEQHDAVGHAVGRGISPGSSRRPRRGRSSRCCSVRSRSSWVARTRGWRRRGGYAARRGRWARPRHR